MDALENLIAQQEIRDLSARYAMFLDDHDWGALAELWTEDAVWSIGDVAWARSPAMPLPACDRHVRAAITDRLPALPGRYRVMPVISCW
jgi:hypothetical protein